MSKIKYLNVANSADYLTVDEVSTETNLRPETIRNYLNLDRLTTYKFKTLTLISREEIEKLEKK